MDASKEDHQSKASNTEIVRSFLFPAGPWPASLKAPTLPEKIPKRMRERLSSENKQIRQRVLCERGNVAPAEKSCQQDLQSLEQCCQRSVSN